MSSHTDLINVEELYDGLASTYRLTYTDWDQWCQRTKVTLKHLMAGRCRDARRILDCAAGIGTQSLVLAEIGYEVTATDISSKAIEQLKTEAEKRELRLPTKVCSWQELETMFRSNSFDVIICFGNCLAHLPDRHTTKHCLNSMLACLRLNGHLIFNLQDYDKILLNRPSSTVSDDMPDSHYNASYYQRWDWVDSERYRSTWYINGKAHCSTMMRAITESEILDICQEIGASCSILNDINYFKIFDVTKTR